MQVDDPTIPSPSSLSKLFRSLAIPPILNPSGAIPKQFLLTILTVNLTSIQDPLFFKYILLQLQKLPTEDIDQNQFIRILSSPNIKGWKKEGLEVMYEEIVQGGQSIKEREMHGLLKVVGGTSEDSARVFAGEKEMVGKVMRGGVGKEMFMEMFMEMFQ